MSADILREVIAAGVELAINDTGNLKVTGDRIEVDRWLPEIRAHKSELLALLSGAEPPPPTPAVNEAIREAIEERAAIREFEVGESRPVAERDAQSAMRVYRFRLTDQPDTWLTMLAPECDQDQARHDLALRFGAERLIEVRESAA
ncbi:MULTISPECIES: hypothetical protein [unclassified Thiocapsa]|uniref:hypothetical protein n=1 Tax=unclassified Thiocapsa TaxID=2641286 RepID=UPI0035B1C700